MNPIKIYITVRKLSIPNSSYVSPTITLTPTRNALIKKNNR